MVEMGFERKECGIARRFIGMREEWNKRVVEGFARVCIAEEFEFLCVHAGERCESWTGHVSGYDSLESMWKKIWFILLLKNG